MTRTSEKRALRGRRHHRVRAKIIGTSARPRVAVFKSSKHIFAQAIDDAAGKTLAGLGDFTIKKASSAAEAKGRKEKLAFTVGESLASQLQKLDIKEAVFDKGGFKYHGRIKALAEGLRSGGIKI